VTQADAHAEMRILIVKSSSLGDIVLALPMLRALRQARPRAYIAWVVESPFQDLLAGNRDLDRLFVVDRANVRATVVSLYRAVRQIRADGFDVVVDLQGWIKSQLLCKLSGARSAVGVMKKNELGFHVLARGVPDRPETHAADLFLEVARLLGAEATPASFDVPILEADSEYIDGFLATLSPDPNAGIAVLQPGSSWTNKRWSLGKLAEVGRALSANGDLVPVVPWGPGERADAAEVVRLIGDRGVLAPPTTIRQLAALLRRSALYVGTDSGPMHLASALGVPTVGLFGPSDPVRFAPYRQPARVVRRDLPCSPCGKPVCRYRTVECMASIEVAEVLEAIGSVTRQAPLASSSPSAASTSRRGSLV
jgi:ADP-heptose:LPS heptosyltransferase